MLSLSGVGIVCFAASYAVALLLEVSRLFFRSGVRGAMMVGFGWAGLVAHSLYLYYHAANAVGAPLSSNQDWYLVTAWVLVVTYLYLTHFHPKTSFGLFVLPLVLGLIAVGAFVDDAPFAREPASRIWGIIHGTSIVLATVTVLFGFAAGLMYLGQAHRLKRKLPPTRGFRLPSLEWLQRANGRAIVISLLMLGVGVLSGVILNLIQSGRHGGGLPWSDPFVLSTWIMFGWLLLCAVVSVFYKPARQGRKVAYLTLVSFVFLVIALGTGLFLDTQHGGPRPKQPSGKRAGVMWDGFIRISHQSGTVRNRVRNRVPLLRRSSARHSLQREHCFCEAVAHGGEKCGFRQQGFGLPTRRGGPA